MAEHVKGSIGKIEYKVKHGVCKLKKTKIKKEVLDKELSPEIRKLVQGADNVTKNERKAINKENRKHAHNVIADVRAEISKDAGTDLGMKMT